MKTGLKREEWIGKVLQSMDAIVPAEVNPYLYQKILRRLTNAKEAVSPRVIWATALGMILLILVNLAAIRQTAAEKPTTNDVNILLRDYHLNDEPFLAK